MKVRIMRDISVLVVFIEDFSNCRGWCSVVMLQEFAGSNPG